MKVKQKIKGAVSGVFNTLSGKNGKGCLSAVWDFDLMKKLISLVLALVFFAATQAQAADQYIYDPLHTQIFFSESHGGFSNSKGRFLKFSGGFTFDQAKPEATQANITIDVNSLDMASADWEKHMKSADFFNVQKFPMMAFKSTKVVKTGDKTADLTGDFTLLGVTKPVTLHVVLNKVGIFPMNNDYKTGFSLTGTLKRSDFGMKGFIPMIGDDVALDIQVEGVRQDFSK